MKWLEVSLTLNGELAEAAAEVISRYTQNSIAMEYPLEGEQLPPYNQVTLRAYLRDDQDLEEARRAIETGLWHLSQIEPFDPPHFNWIEEEHWEDAWKDHFQPIKVGERLLVQPAWLPIEDSRRIPILMDPGMAFGTGTHPTTQLCLLALEQYLQPGQRVVDLGCGSGILSIAAAKLGASQVLALDIDPIAVDYAKENVEQNGLSGEIEVVQGSLAYLQRDVDLVNTGIDILIANILTKILLQLLQEGLVNTLRPEGLLVLSGILDHQVEEILQAAEDSDLEYLATGVMQDWRSLILKRKSPH